MSLEYFDISGSWVLLFSWQNGFWCMVQRLLNYCDHLPGRYRYMSHSFEPTLHVLHSRTSFFCLRKVQNYMGEYAVHLWILLKWAIDIIKPYFQCLNFIILFAHFLHSFQKPKDTTSTCFSGDNFSSFPTEKILRSECWFMKFNWLTS